MLSIIIPTLNEEKYLPLLLHSIKNQDFADYEIIVADAGSNDQTKAIAQQYGCLVVPGGLLPAGRNRGAEASRGEVLLFLDADVILPAHFLKNAVEKMARYQLGIAGFPMLPHQGNAVDRLAHNILNLFSYLTQRWAPYASAAILVNKEVYQSVGGFDETITFIEDYPFAKAASRVAKYKFLDDQPFYTSMRRYEKDGRFRVYSKYILAQVYMIFFGPIKSDIFKYKFNHYIENRRNTNK